MYVKTNVNTAEPCMLEEAYRFTAMHASFSLKYSLPEHVRVCGKTITSGIRYLLVVAGRAA